MIDQGWECMCEDHAHSQPVSIPLQALHSEHQIFHSLRALDDNFAEMKRLRSDVSLIALPSYPYTPRTIRQPQHSAMEYRAEVPPVGNSPNARRNAVPFAAPEPLKRNISLSASVANAGLMRILQVARTDGHRANRRRIGTRTLALVTLLPA